MRYTHEQHDDTPYPISLYLLSCCDRSRPHLNSFLVCVNQNDDDDDGTARVGSTYHVIFDSGLGFAPPPSSSGNSGAGHFVWTTRATSPSNPILHLFSSPSKPLYIPMVWGDERKEQDIPYTSNPSSRPRYGPYSLQF